jgi:hypothetical protein
MKRYLKSLLVVGSTSLVLMLLIYVGIAVTYEHYDLYMWSEDARLDLLYSIIFVSGMSLLIPKYVSSAVK